jgi:Na+/melibiose symporter-like transporter
VLFYLTFKSEPEHPPSAVALKIAAQNNFIDEAHTLLKNKNFVIIAVVFSLTMATQNTFGIIVDSLFSPFGLDSTDFSIIGGSVIGVGLMSAIAFGAILDRTHKFKASILVIAGCVIALFFWFIKVILQRTYGSDPDDGSKALMFGTCLAYGLISVPMLPACMAFAAEVTFPMQPSVFTGLMLFG